MESLFLFICIVSLMLTCVFSIAMLIKRKKQKDLLGTKKKIKISAVVFAVSLVLYLVAMPKCDHDYDVVESKEATCVEKGYEKKVCTKCGEEIETVTEVTHDWKTESTSPATCTSPKKTEKICLLCGEKITETEGKPVHSFGEWTVTKQSTSYEEGEKTRSCTVCGQTETKKIKKKDYIELTANELYTAYEENEIAAEEKYDGKKVKITGVINTINSSGFLTDDNILLSVKSKNLVGCVQCNFSSDAAKDLAELQKGSTVTIMGTCNSMSAFNVMVLNCKIVK